MIIFSFKTYFSNGKLQRYCRRYYNKSYNILRWTGKRQYLGTPGASYNSHVSLLTNI